MTDRDDKAPAPPGANFEPIGQPPTLAPNQFRCMVCHGVFEKGWSEEEALAELAADWPGVGTDACELVCDTCYIELGFGDES